MGLRAGVIGLACAALLGGALPATAAPADQAASCGGGPSSSAMATTLYTFRVEAKPVKKTYVLGQKAKVHMTVTRPGSQDPLGEGQPMPTSQSFAAENVEVSVSFYLGEYHYTYGIGVTDANGEEVVTVPLPKDAPAGPVRAAVAARAYYNRGGCPDFEEVGYNYYEPFMVAKR
jgi:hypothetical protein